MTLHAMLAAAAVVAAAVSVSASTMHASPPLELLNATVVSLGEASFVAPMLSRLTRNLPLTIVAIGSSITARHGGCTHALIGGAPCAEGAPRTSGWLRHWFDNAINSSWPHTNHRLLNAGIAASAPSAFTECLTWLPDRVDLFVIEFVAAKDIQELAARLLSRQAAASAPPVLCFVTFHRWIMPMEGAHARIMSSALRLGMPFLSQLRGLSSRWRGVEWSRLVKEHRDARCGSAHTAAERRLECWGPAAQAPDGLHPSSYVGQAFMGEALALWLKRSHERYVEQQQQQVARPSQTAYDRALEQFGGGLRASLRRVTLSCFTFDARHLGRAPLSEALLTTATSSNMSLDADLPGETRAAMRKVMHRHHTSHSLAADAVGAGLGPDGGQPPRIQARDGFSYILYNPAAASKTEAAVGADTGGTDGAGGARRFTEKTILDAKAGLSASCPGDWLSLDVTPSASEAASAAVTRPYYVAFDHLTSYAHMGRAIVTCHRGCSCEPTTIDAHAPEERASLRALHYIEVAPTPSLSSSASSSLDRCSVRVTIANGTSSGEHRFQIVRVAVGGHQELPEHLILFSPPPSPPPPPSCVSSGLKGDAAGPARCEGFCKEANAPRHCLLCKCSSCSFCANGKPRNANRHKQKDLDAATSAAAAVPPPPSPPPPSPPPEQGRVAATPQDAKWCEMRRARTSQHIN